MYPTSVFAKICWSIQSKVVKLSKNARSKQKSHSHTNSTVSREVYVHALLVQHLCTVVYSFNTNTVAHLHLQYVFRFELRHQLAVQVD